MTERGKALLGVALAMWMVSRLFGIPELQMVAVAIVALVALAVALTRLLSARLETRRRVHPTRLFYDAEGTVRIELRNIGRLPTALLQVTDDAPTVLADGARFVLAPLRPGDGVAVEYDLHARQRGRYAVGPLTVKLRDPFGVATRTQRFQHADHVTVYPPVWHLPAGVPLGGHPGRGGEGQPRPLPAGDELANVREYVRGDDLRKVHWRSTAHRGKLMVRQDEAPQNPQASVVLDRRAQVHAGTGPQASFEMAVSAAASVTYHLASRRYAVRLFTEPIQTAPQPAPWEHTLERLAVIEPQQGTDLGPLWRQLSQGVAGNGVLVAIVALPDATDLRHMVRAGRGFSTRLAVLLDTGSFVGRQGADVERTVGALRAANWRVTLVRHGDRLDARWQELMLHRRPGIVAPAGAGTSPGGGR